MLTTGGANRAFPVLGPQVWNDLPADVTSAESLSRPTLRQQLKTHLFSKTFPGYILDILCSSRYCFGHFKNGDCLLEALNRCVLMFEPISLPY